MAWLASVADAITGISVVAKKILDRLWGDQTSKDASLEREGEKWQKEFTNARETGDLIHANFSLSQMRRVREALDAIRKREG